ncbi:alanine--tRNA ligase [Niabella yanshanensis]|uniref:Alanine--tRNA ligase n=1 Tax=Niabella yanshanensis TaxID=577386 RepID=A0ABZ0W2D1_9BACT|nr:alanine--tRNA ligase [Niabella yanshanensis]WQD36874.1 alanine--tRNA ligase [Niabella yanshanensis]
MTSSEIREQFLEFFKTKGHHIVPSAPIVVKNDPTLMFTNAGMNQFKDFFLGNQKSPNPRVADTQKCLRVSGKHNDLEEVGVDTYHHTMFEMLGNWSFGDSAPVRTGTGGRPAGGYFKKEAIAWSWELLTEVYKIDKDKLYVTVFEGDEKEGLPFDQEAYDEWARWINPERILKGNKKDNFWEMGDTGPCGPCSEIHVDCRPNDEREVVDGKTLVNADHPQVIEIWNNVFIQFNRKKDGSLESLPARHVDTGMGFERLVRVLQGKTSNYDTDVFTGTIAEIEKITGKQYDFSDSKQAVAFRVLADHIRAISFTVADGQLPSNTGAGYVIRRILRRAVRYYYSYLDYKQPLLHQLIPVIAAQFATVFPELQQQGAFVTKVIREEEDSFLRTLEKGLKRIDDIVQASTGGEINGKDAFELYDTYGFPADLTRLIASENNLQVDEAGFKAEMEQQKNRSRAATAVDTEDWILVTEETPSTFIGYEQLQAVTHVVKYRKVKAKGKEQYQLVLQTTPFYAESGGQVGDKGSLQFGEEKVLVTDTKKENDLIIHFTDKLPGQIELELLASVNAEERARITYNHTATHLLHAALKQVLGTHVNQKGSMVSPEVLRFDVSHFSKITDEEIKQVEQIVNRKVRENHPVVIKEMPKDEAMKLGAMALFGEKYGDTVRVVTADPAFSVELCGGTHVQQTGSIGLFIITSEGAVAAGVRRIEALTGQAAFDFVTQKLDEYKQVTEVLKSKEPLKAIEKLSTEKTTLDKRVERLEAKELVGIRNELLQKDEIVNQVNFIGDIVEVSNADALKKLCADLKNHLKDFVIVLCANIGGKPFVAVSVADNVVAARGLDAGQIIKQHIAPLIKGGGGGQKTLATAGGQDAGQLPQVIEAVKSML